MEHVDPVRRLTSMVNSISFIDELHRLINSFGLRLTNGVRNFEANWGDTDFQEDDPGKHYTVTKDGCFAFRTKDGKTAYAMTTIEVTIGPVLSEEEYASIAQKEVKSLL